MMKAKTKAKATPQTVFAIWIAAALAGSGWIAGPRAEAASAPDPVPSSAPSGAPGAGLDAGFLDLPAHDVEAIAVPGKEERKVKVGDELLLRVVGLSVPGAADPAKGLELQVPVGTENLNDQGWEIAPAGGAPVGELRFRAVPLKPGRLILPSLAVVPAGQPVGAAVARTHPFTAEVESAVKAGDPKPEEPADLRPPVSLGFPWWIVAVIALFAAALLVAAVYAYRRLRRPKAVSAKPAEPPRPEDEVALAALAELERAGPLRRGEFKAHYFRLSEILKAYLGARYGIDAVESTTREMLAMLEEKRPAGGARGPGRPSEPGAMDDQRLDRLESLFAKLDLVKFTDHVPVPDEGQRLLEQARELVQATRRPPAPVSATTPGTTGAPLGKGTMR